jgi:hypothetical protein
MRRAEGSNPFSLGGARRSLFAPFSVSFEQF